MCADACCILPLAPSPFMKLFISVSPPPVTSVAQLLGATSPPWCVGPVKWKMAATERAHFREPSSFEGAWWPLTATVLTQNPQEHSAAIIAFTKAKVEESGSRGDSNGGCLNPEVVGRWSGLQWWGAVGKHDMGSLTDRWRLCFNSSDEPLPNRSFRECVPAVCLCSPLGVMWLLSNHHPLPDRHWCYKHSSRNRFLYLTKIE